MEVFVNKQELGGILGLDGRTAISRYNLTPDAVLLNRNRELLLYRLDRIKNLLQAKRNASVVVNAQL